MRQEKFVGGDCQAFYIISENESRPILANQETPEDLNMSKTGGNIDNDGSSKENRTVGATKTTEVGP